MAADNDLAGEALRKKLQKMTEVADVSQHPAVLAALAREFPDTVRQIKSLPPIGRYTCLMHALSSRKKPEYETIARYTCVFASPEFAHWLIDNGVLAEVSPHSVSEGDLVFYFGEDGRFKHAGRSIANGRVESKWA